MVQLGSSDVGRIMSQASQCWQGTSGIIVTVNIIAVRGSIRLFLKGGDVWIHIKLTPMWGDEINIEQRILDL